MWRQPPGVVNPTAFAQRHAARTESVTDCPPAPVEPGVAYAADNRFYWIHGARRTAHGKFARLTIGFADLRPLAHQRQSATPRLPRRQADGAGARNAPRWSRSAVASLPGGQRQLVALQGFIVAVVHAAYAALATTIGSVGFRWTHGGRIRALLAPVARRWICHRRAGNRKPRRRLDRDDRQRVAVVHGLPPAATCTPTAPTADNTAMPSARARPGDNHARQHMSRPHCAGLRNR